MLNDTALLELIQRQTFRYFWDFAHPVSGLARDRSDPKAALGLDTVAIGASGFGIMAILVAVERHWIARKDAVNRLLQAVRFLAITASSRIFCTAELVRRSPSAAKTTEAIS